MGEASLEELLEEVKTGPISDLRLHVWVPFGLTLAGEPVSQEVAMAMILDTLLARGLSVDGFTDGRGGRTYHYRPLVVTVRASWRQALALVPLAAAAMSEHRFHRWRHGHGWRARLTAAEICGLQAVVTLLGGGVVLTDERRQSVLYATPRRPTYYARLAAAALGLWTLALVVAAAIPEAQSVIIGVAVALGVVGVASSAGRPATLLAAVGADNTLGSALRRARRPYWMLDLLAVAAGERDKGVGSALIEELQRLVGPPVFVRAGEQRAARLYRDRGFVDELAAVELPAGIRTSVLRWDPKAPGPGVRPG